jgi:hypothetical protein
LTGSLLKSISNPILLLLILLASADMAIIIYWQTTRTQ